MSDIWRALFAFFGVLFTLTGIVGGFITGEGWWTLIAMVGMSLVITDLIIENEPRGHA